MADDIDGRLEMYLLTPVPESQNSSGYELFRLPVPPKQLDGYLKRLDPKAKIVPDLMTLQYKAVKIIKQHLQRENLGLGVVKLVEQRVYSRKDAEICPPVNIVYVVLRPTSKGDHSMVQHQIESISSENVVNTKPTLSTTYVQIAEIMPNEGNVECLQAKADPQLGITDQSIAPIVTRKKKQKPKKGKLTRRLGPSDHHRALTTVYEQKEEEDDDKNQSKQEGVHIHENCENSATSVDAGISDQSSTPESSTDILSRLLESLRAATRVGLGETESTNSMIHSSIPPSDAPTAIMIPPTHSASALVPASPKSPVQGNPMKEHTNSLRHFAAAHPPSRKIFSRNSTANPPVATTSGNDSSLTSVDLPRPLFSMETVSLQPPIHDLSSNPTAVPPMPPTGIHPALCPVCTRIVATDTATPSSICFPPTTLGNPALVQQPLTAPAPSFAHSFDPPKFDFEFKHGKDKY